MQRAGNKIRSEKIVIIGSASTGKTSLLNRFVHDRFSTVSEATIGASFVQKIITVDGTDVKLEIWDTGGSEKYRSLTPMYYRDARAAVLVYDITNEVSFQEAEQWYSEFRERGQPNAIVVCAANKCDLESQRKVSKKSGEDFALNNQIEYIKETSALSGEGIRELFNDLAKELLTLAPQEIGNEIEITDVDNDGGNKDGCKC
ncbi:Ras family protein [Histomonas meleagridis]|uniref:Ras family protein n=1 Tax=Histomonas meleagridis TaxID=135588 RepID=UPI0035596B72|nr:Ras family protein [Histomonas meleagridis]KAH0803224.1 Ras family protein [Histomonas meleagridis]